MKLIASLVVAASVAGGSAQALAQSDSTDHASHHPAAAASAPAPNTDGEVRKIDKDRSTVTLKHGRIENLGMTPMTMVFKVSDPKVLDTLKPGDKVRFAADNINGALTVTAIEPAR